MTFRPIFFPLFALLACRNDPRSPAPDTGTAAVSGGGLQGKVWTPDGEPVAGALVQVGSQTTTTNALGFFVLQDLPGGQVVITVQADGHSTSGVVRELREGAWSYAGLRVVPVETLSWDPLDGAAVESAAGVQIGLGRLLDASGAEASGPVTVSVALLNDAESIGAAPGELMAEGERPLTSLGMVEVRLTDATGGPVQLAEPATLSFPIADVPDTRGFTLFGYDEATGRWSKVGGGEVADGRFEAEVEHFSWWNADAFSNTDQCVTGTLVASGEPVVNKPISVEERESLTSGSFRTDEDGRFTIGLPAGATVQLSLGYSDYSWESEVITLPDDAVAQDDRPEGCVDLGEAVATSSDEDRDGFPGVSFGGPDCDDTDAAINPVATDAPYSGVDEDCGGEDDYDQDGDGYVPDDYIGRTTVYVPGSGDLPGGDCDDEQYLTNPGRGESCDGTDNNCSGDETDARDILTWYLDADSDSYGTDSSASRSCTAPTEDWVSLGGDCDDTDPAFHPGAEEDCAAPEDNNCDGSAGTDNADGDEFVACEDCDDRRDEMYPGADEVCDGLDNDCDGVSDDNPIDESTFYIDEDGDGYGDPNTSDHGCTVPDGYVEDVSNPGEDCDDLDADRHPDAPEICEDGVIQDCDATAEEAQADCDWSGDVRLSTARARLIGEADRDYTGSAVSTAGDANGDGVPDLLIGAPNYESSGSRTGAAHLVLSPVRGDLDLALADATLIGEEADDGAGSAVSAAGDVDGDGYGDLLVGAHGNGGGAEVAGAAYLIAGPVSGEVALATADARLLGANEGDQAGWAVAQAGDANGDAISDLFVGARFNSAGGERAGAAYLVLGPVSGEVELSAADASLFGEQAWSSAGYAVSTAGDADGDGLADLLVGSSEVDGSGAAYLVLSPVSGDLDLAAADAKLVGELAGDTAGTSVATAGDTNGDGLADLLVGAQLNDDGGSSAGSAYLISSPVSGELSLASADAKLIGEASFDLAGTSVAGAGDIDADGLTDLLVGAQANDGGGSGAGAVYLLLGPVSGHVDLSAATVRFLGEQTGDLAGCAVSPAGDIDEDGRPDLLVGAYMSYAGGAAAGAAYLLAPPSY